MEHKLLSGGEKWLPFARGRIKAMLASGLAYASQKFVMPDGVTLLLSTKPGHEYIQTTRPEGDIWLVVRLDLNGPEVAPDVASRVFRRSTHIFRLSDFDAKSAYHQSTTIGESVMYASFSDVTNGPGVTSKYLSNVSFDISRVSIPAGGIIPEGGKVTSFHGSPLDTFVSVFGLTPLSYGAPSNLQRSLSRIYLDTNANGSIDQQVETRNESTTVTGFTAVRWGTEKAEYVVQETTTVAGSETVSYPSFGYISGGYTVNVIKSGERVMQALNSVGNTLVTYKTADSVGGTSVGVGAIVKDYLLDTSKPFSTMPGAENPILDTYIEATSLRV